ncbi:hypothetical protein [Salinicola tamaricis]|uniref:hypothetical protein n=1 Tax=Salinicola tamaricis TaxID=1771309 RepID=UPI000D0A18D8|nr:hypothetical protein [Salinicola tamaricis]
MRVHAAIIGERLMTGHECHYAKKVVAMHRYIFWFLMLTGVLTFCMGLGLPIAFSMDTLTLDVAGFLLLAFLTLGPMAGGIWIFWLGYKRRVCFSPRVSIIRGIMTIRKKPVPSGAGSINYVNEYYVGNVLLHGPPGSSVILDRLHGKFIEVHALFMHIYPSINLSKRYKGIDEALLFNLNDQINLDALFRSTDAVSSNVKLGVPGFLSLCRCFSLSRLPATSSRS